MSTNFQKTPLVQSLAKSARAQAQDAGWSSGKSYPCTVAEVVGPGIVVVNFEMSGEPFTLHQIKMPVAKPPYIKYPIKVGDKGVAMSADAQLGAMSGLGGGNPNPQTPVGNLSALMFVWLGNVAEEFLDSEAVTVFDNIVASADKLAFFGETKVAKQTLPGPASSGPSTEALANAIRTLLINYGLAS